MTYKNQNKNWICVGVILGPHGVNGRLKIKSFCETPQSIITYNPLMIEGFSELFNFDMVANVDSTLQVQSKKINNRDSALSLKGKLLFAARNKMPNSDTNEYYFADLIGLKVKEFDGKPFGSVKNVGNFGAGPFLEILNNKTLDTVFLPFDKTSIPIINLDDRYLIVKEFPEEFLKESN